MSKFILISLLYLPFYSYAQFFSNSSANLPDIGANGASMDVRTADLDGDGDLDIILANEFQPNTILSNDGSGVFSNTTLGNLPQENHDSEDVAIADFNNDGHLDLIFCSEDDVVLGWTNVHEYYLGDGNGSFAEADFQFPDSEANAVIAADINSDGFLDVLFGNNGTTSVFINNGDGTFSQENDRVPQVNRTTQDLSMADVDGDGDLDLFEGNENGNLLHINDGTGTFSDETLTRLPKGLNIETRKVTFADVDGDGDLDVFLSNVQFIPGKDPQNRLYMNDGTGNFTDVSMNQLPLENDFTLDAVFEDVDQDGDLDIILANFSTAPLKVYLNNGTGFFANNTLDVLGENYFRDALGVIAADLNGDGLNDVYACDRRLPNSSNKDLLLLRNPIPNAQTNLSTQNFDLVLSPNPAKDTFYIYLKNTSPDFIKINDSNGRLVQTIASTTNNEIEVDVSNYKTGIYMIVACYKNDQKIVRKLIKE